ncbi:MAG: hypothetical protein EOP46_21060 [Sphingobacteriaceae bacterium]|nr:MAG: hypothetical protein EOP46_21060 [Sphingobacteriaceae bacterium]
MKIFYTLILAACSIAASAQTDTIHLKDKRLMTTNLTTGTKQYLVYFQSPAKSKVLSTSLWMRDIKTETRNNIPVIVTNQHWYGADSAQYRSITSVNRKADFAPIYHSETIGTKTKAYNWYADKVAGDSTVTGNTAQGFSQDTKEYPFNWNLDIETFEMLPLAAGKTFALYFYDAGTVPPAYVVYKVAGSEMLSLLDNQKVECWKLVHEGNFRGSAYIQTFWISKKSHEFIKEEDAFNGGYRYKVKLPGAATDILKRFK